MKKIYIFLRNKKYIIPNRKNIEEIYLYGSYARGENDKFSDLDIFILCKNKKKINKKFLAKKLKVKEKWISVYTRETINKFFEEGSLFLWHLKNEGVILYSKKNELSEKLRKLDYYKKVKFNLLQYKEILEDVKLSFQNDLKINGYELNLLAVILRNTAILHCYINKKYYFGRYNAFIKSQELLDNLIPFSLYKILYDYRIFYRENIKINLKLLNEKELIKMTEIYIEEVILEYERKYSKFN